MNPLERTFRDYETTLSDIINRYPEPSTIVCSGLAPGTVRQLLSRSLRYYNNAPYVISTIPRDKALLLEQAFVFSQNDDGTVYVGPRRNRRAKSKAYVAVEGLNTPSLPPIDCTRQETLFAILHLKNYEHLTTPLTIYNVNLPPDWESKFPNIELNDNPDGTFTIL